MRWIFPEYDFEEKPILISQKFLDRFEQLMEDVRVKASYNFEKGAFDFIARPKSDGVYPAVIVIHDVWGLDAYIKTICLRLAKEGYVALAVDLFAGNTTVIPRTAKKFLERMNLQHDMEIIRARFHKLIRQPFVDALRVAFMGFLAGGFYSLYAATHFLNLAGAVSFYGRFPHDIFPHLSKIGCPVLCFAGGQGKLIYRDNVARLKKTLEENSYPAEVRIYEDANPAFFDELHLEHYHARATEDAWQCVFNFFKKRLTPLTEEHQKLKRHFGKFGGKVIDQLDKTALGSKFLSLLEDALGEEEEEK